MDATERQLTQLAETIARNLEAARVAVDQVRPAAEAFAATQPPGTLGKLAFRLGATVTDEATTLLERLRDLAAGIAAPALLFVRAYRWQTVRGTAATVAGALRVEALPATGLWSGPAATAYRSATRPQSDAAARIAAVAERTATALATSAVAGVAFYVAVAGVVAQLVSALCGAVDALLSGAFAVLGLGAVLAELTLSRTMLAAAVAGVVTVLAAQAQQLAVLHGEAGDNSAWPGGRWPDPLVAVFADASVADGDADWSLDPS